eukprot:Platyproteum_vivax@DN1600_c0_g1_i1.p2
MFAKKCGDGLESLRLDEWGLKNEGLQALASNLDASTLQKLKSLNLYCGLSGQKGGAAIRCLLQKCGDGLESLKLNDSSLDNNSLQAVVNNLEASKLQKLKSLNLYCGLSGQKGGAAIRCLLQKCGDGLESLKLNDSSLDNNSLQAVVNNLEASKLQKLKSL